jgi:hypothetical protein
MIFKILTLATVIVLTNFSLADASDCPEINLNQMDIGLEKIPRWDQGEQSYLCYGYAGAVLVDSHRYTSGQSQLENPTSPFVLTNQAVLYSQKLSRRSNFWGGLIDHALQAAHHDGICHATLLRSGIAQLGPQESIELLRGFRIKARHSSERERIEYARELNTLLREKGVDSQLLPDIRTIAGWLTLKEALYIPHFVRALCRETQAVNIGESTSQDRSYSPGQLSLAEQLNHLLIAETPVAVEFCAEVVTDRSFVPGWDNQCSRHYAIVVGQRYQNNQCELLVRDSQCSAYSRTQNVCRDGHYWIGKQSFLSNSYRMTWL